MKKILLASAAMSFVCATPALAAPPIEVTMDVQEMCQVTHQPELITVTPTMNENPESPDFGEPTSFSTDVAPDNVGVFCNVPGSVLTIAATELVSDNAVSSGAASAGFTGTVDFAAVLRGGRENDTSTAVWDDSTGSLPTAGNGYDSYEYGVYRGELDLTLSNMTPRGGDALISGDYDGSVTITLSPETTFGAP